MEKYILEDITKKQALELFSLRGAKLMELFNVANKIREKYCGNMLHTCTISNAKSGVCKEDCKFCAQSLHYDTKIKTYGLKTVKELTNELDAAIEIGSENFGVVTSGTTISINSNEFDTVKNFYKINKEKNIKTCASIGYLTYEAAILLKENGLTRYHNNLQTSIESYKDIVATTHSIDDRIASIRNAKKAGLKVCSGGIIGMGESDSDLVSMAFTLKELNVDCIPINILSPIKGTPFENYEIEPIERILKMIAIYRLILKDKKIKITAGRESILKDFMGLAFMCGANSLMIGGYLTIKGREVEEDKKLINEITKMWGN